MSLYEVWFTMQPNLTWYRIVKMGFEEVGTEPTSSLILSSGKQLPPLEWNSITGVKNMQQKQTSRRKGLEFFNCDYP
jgi:hypothetical protein